MFFNHFRFYYIYHNVFRPWQLRRILSLLKRDKGIQPWSALVIESHDFTCSHGLNPSTYFELLQKMAISIQIFSRDQKSGDRDVFNERPTREEQTVAAASINPRNGLNHLADSATIHTTVGDIHMRLFSQYAPKAVENFVGHARSGYFEGVVFHRVIPKFMIQTGDPLGDGTGGMSIWGREFEDEFTDEVKHDR